MIGRALIRRSGKNPYFTGDGRWAAYSNRPGVPYYQDTNSGIISDNTGGSGSAQSFTRGSSGSPVETAAPVDEKMTRSVSKRHDVPHERLKTIQCECGAKIKIPALIRWSD